MKKSKLPSSDSIRELAQFWDAHDLTDFEDELEEVTQPVFRRDEAAIAVSLQPREMKAVERLATGSGISKEQLVREWILQKIAGRTSPRTRKR